MAGHFGQYIDETKQVVRACSEGTFLFLLRLPCLKKLAQGFEALSGFADLGGCVVTLRPVLERINDGVFNLKLEVQLVDGLGGLDVGGTVVRGRHRAQGSRATAREGCDAVCSDLS